MTRGHVRRLEAIYRSHARRVRWVLRARGIGEHEIEDLVHDVFLAIHRRLPDHDEEVALATWVCGVARSVAHAHRRGDARRRRTVAALPEPDDERLPDEELARREAWRRLTAALDEIHGDQREAFVLVDVLGMRAAEAAEIVAAPVNTVYSRLRLARRHCEMRLRLSERGEAWMRAAAEGERPSEAARERTWSGIVAALPTVGVAAPTALVGWAAGALAITATAAVVVVVANRPAPAETAIETTAAAEVPANAKTMPRSATPAVVPTTVQPATATTTASVSAPPAMRPAKRDAATAVEPPAGDDQLARAVELLRTGEAELARGDALAALRIVDAYRERFAEDALGRDVLRLERRAACAAGDARRAARAHDGLAALHLADRSTAACS